MPSAIDGYSQWTLEAVRPTSRHSAVFSLVSKDRKRGTPHPRGGGKLPEPVTWHTTMLAEVGFNEEGPLPWIEREYTPVSTALEWERGRCDLLVKVYADGQATSWLQKKEPSFVWLSRPVRTLRVPSLREDDDEAKGPASVLLVLAGTGVVVVPQLLAHRDPMRQLGISTPKRKQLHCPIDLVLSCREDDVHLSSEIAAWCETQALRHATLLLTSSSTKAATAPFPEAVGGDAAEAEQALRGLANARVLRSSQRLSPALLADSYARMPQPCRVLVSGPAAFNTAARAALADLVHDDDLITVLSA
mmetsp:Transcript_16180/g.48936  ORF Transcript_16180/g.48936 Transcript_16180/m.48936 type:complete len:304 (-) Transcript_16180:1606-2517(-)